MTEIWTYNQIGDKYKWNSEDHYQQFKVIVLEYPPVKVTEIWRYKYKLNTDNWYRVDCVL